MRCAPGRALVVALLAGVLVLAGCTSPGQGPSSSDRGSGTGQGLPRGGRVDVDTAALRRQKQAAGVAPCRSGRRGSANRLPRVRLSCLGGGQDVGLASIKGPAVVNLFAPWCGPCRAEMPYYQDLHRKGTGTLRVLGIDYLDTRPDRGLALVEQTGVTYPLLADPAGELRTPLRIRYMPSTIFVRRDGSYRVVARSVRSYAELRTLVQDELDLRLPA